MILCTHVQGGLGVNASNIQKVLDSNPGLSQNISCGYCDYLDISTDLYFIGTISA